MNERRAWLSIVWHLKGALNGASWRHVSVIGLIAFWGLVVGIIDYPLYVETRQLASQVKTRNAMNSKSHRAAIKKDTPRDIAGDFVASLPMFEHYPAQLGSLTELAEKAGVLVLRIDYRYENISSLSIRKLTLHLELSGGEPQQRKFLRSVLNTFPNLSIARLAYTKTTDPAANVDEKLDVNLYYRLKKASA